MKQLMSDSEAWAVIGETLRQCNYVKVGLCDVLVRCARERLLEPYQWLRMEHQLYKYRDKVSKGRVHFWPSGKVTPRVRACYKLAEIVDGRKDTWK